LRPCPNRQGFDRPRGDMVDTDGACSLGATSIGCGEDDEDIGR
jgi:hypothetical protein